MDSTRPTASTPRVREPIPADQASFSTGLKGMRMGYTEETEAQERIGWLWRRPTPLSGSGGRSLTRNGPHEGSLYPRSASPKAGANPRRNGALRGGE